MISRKKYEKARKRILLNIILENGQCYGVTCYPTTFQDIPCPFKRELLPPNEYMFTCIGGSCTMFEKPMTFKVLSYAWALFEANYDKEDLFEELL